MPKRVEITPPVRDVLERGTWEGTLFILPPGNLDRALYGGVDRVLVALGGKWNRQMRGHLFTLGSQADLTAALDRGVAVDQKRTNEQFFTPPAIAAQVAERAGIEPDHHVLEPSAGEGALVMEAIRLGAHVTAVDSDSAMMLPLLCIADKHPNRLLRVCEDFLNWRPAGFPSPFDEPFDRVLMNPPFGRGADMAHVSHALDLLRPGGVLVAIMSPHWRFAEDAPSRGFRHLTNQHGYIWEPLPDGSFRSAGTGVNTGILTISKGASI